jgi:hypothetical protein
VSVTGIDDVFVTTTEYETFPPVSATVGEAAVFTTVIDDGIAVLVNVQTTVADAATGTELLVPGVIELPLLVQASDGVYAARPPDSDT